MKRLGYTQKMGPNILLSVLDLDHRSHSKTPERMSEVKFPQQVFSNSIKYCPPMVHHKRSRSPIGLYGSGMLSPPKQKRERTRSNLTARTH